MTIIDFHNHFYPMEYIESLKRGSSKITVTEDEHGKLRDCHAVGQLDRCPHGGRIAHHAFARALLRQGALQDAYSRL